MRDSAALVTWAYNARAQEAEPGTYYIRGQPGLLQGGTQGLWMHHPHLQTEPLCLHSEHLTRTHLVVAEEDSNTYRCLPLATLKVVPMAQDASSLERYSPPTPHPDPRLTHPHQGLPRDYLTLYDTWRRLPLPEPGVKPSRENPAAKEKKLHQNTKTPDQLSLAIHLFPLSPGNPMGITYSFLCLLSLCFSSLEGEVGLPWQAWAGKGLSPLTSSRQLAKNTQSPKVTPSFKVQAE